MSKKKHNELILDYVKFHVSCGTVTKEWVLNMLNQVKP
jgi:hypothetical protein